MAKGKGKGGIDERAVRSMKIFVIALNVITALAGLTLLGFGVYSMFRSDLILYSRSIPVTMIVTGSLIFLLSFVGCLGAEMESRFMLVVYFGLLISLVIVQIVITIYTFANMDKVDDVIEKAWQRAFTRRPKLLRAIEDEYSCCGFRDIHDRAVPDNCSTSPYYGYQVSCYSQLVDAYKAHQGSIGGIGALIGVIQIAAILATAGLIRYLPTEAQRDRNERDEYERLVSQKKPGKTGNEYGSTSRA